MSLGALLPLLGFSCYLYTRITFRVILTVTFLLNTIPMNPTTCYVSPPPGPYSLPLPNSHYWFPRSLHSVSYILRCLRCHRPARRGRAILFFSLTSDFLLQPLSPRFHTSSTRESSLPSLSSPRYVYHHLLSRHLTGSPTFSFNAPSTAGEININRCGDAISLLKTLHWLSIARGKQAEPPDRAPLNLIRTFFSLKCHPQPSPEPPTLYGFFFT